MSSTSTFMTIDAEWLREEIRERVEDVGGYAHLRPLLDLPDDVLLIAMDNAVGDYFWEALDSMRSDAINALATRYDLYEDNDA